MGISSGYLGPLAAILVATSTLSTIATAAALDGETHPLAAPLCSRDASLSPPSISLPEGEGSSPLPSAKVAEEACASVDVVALTGEDLISYLRSTSEDCLKRTLQTSRNPSIRGDLPAIFSAANMQSVFAQIEESSAAYDGTNSTGMRQLWFFVRLGYSYHRFFQDKTGVGPFDEATYSAYLAASDAFAASDHFHASNDEAARVLYAYFEIAYTAGMGQNHLAPMKQVLSGMTPDRAASQHQSRAFEHILNRIHAAVLFDGNQLVLDALAQDPEFVDVLLQVTRYDFFFLLEEDHPETPRLGLLETAVNILVRLSRLDSLRETAVAALTSVLSWHERLSGPFLIAARGLEDQVDCGSLNICRGVLETEIRSQALPNTYRFDNGALVFETPLDLEEIRPLYQALKEVKAQFHRLVETDETVRDDWNVFTAKIYGTWSEYARFDRYRTGLNTRGIYRGGFYERGTMATFQNEDLEEAIRHEYVHYLAERFGLLLHSPWFDEGLAEFLVGSTQVEGIPVRWSLVLRIAWDEASLDPATLFNSTYSAEIGGARFYYYAGLFFHFMHQQRRTQLLELFDLVREGNRSAYDDLVAAWAEDTHLAEEYALFLGVHRQDFDWSWEPPTATSFARQEALTSDSAQEIGTAMNRVDRDLDLNCRSLETEIGHRFECTGTLSANPGFSGNRGALNEHFNTRLDGFMRTVLDQGEINNLQYMTCYFANAAGSPPAADLYCEGPLRPMGLAQRRVDLRATLDRSGDSTADVGERLILWAPVDFAGKLATNVTLTWSASLPVLLSASCEVVESTDRSGTFSCGNFNKETQGGAHRDITLYLTPLEAGSLDFSIEFSSDEVETEPSDNAASLQWTIALIPNLIRTLSGHTNPVWSVAFSPDGTTLASASSDSTVKLWSTETAKNTATLYGHTDIVLSVAFSPDGTTLASGAHDGTIRLWDVARASNTAILYGHTDYVWSLAFSPDGRTLASGSFDDTARLWDLENQASIATIEGHQGGVGGVAFSRDGRMLATGAGDGTARVWDLERLGTVATLSVGIPVRFVVFSPESLTVAIIDASGAVKLWDVATGETTDLSTDDVLSAVFSPEGTALATGSWNDEVQLWDVETATDLATFRGHTEYVQSVVFSPDGAILASGSGDHTVKLWDVAHWTLPGPRRLVRISGDEQEGPANAELADPLVVEVRDQNGDPFEGAQVTFTVTACDGILSEATGVTDARGRASTTLTLGGELGTCTVAATVTDIESVTFTASARATPDFDGDGEVGFADFFLFAEAFGGSDPRFDLDASGAVDFADFFLFAEHFGQPARAKLVALARELIGLPETTGLHQNAPNPFNSGTIISWVQLQAGPARLEVFSLTGQRVAVLHEGARKIGVHNLHWDGRDDQRRPLASGVYVFRLVTAEGVQARKLTLLR